MTGQAPVAFPMDGGSLLGVVMSAATAQELEDLLVRLRRLGSDATNGRPGAPRVLLDLYDALAPALAVASGRVSDADTPRVSSGDVSALLGRGALPDMGMREAQALLGLQSERQVRRLFPRASRPAAGRVLVADVERELRKRGGGARSSTTGLRPAVTGDPVGRVAAGGARCREGLAPPAGMLP